MPYKANEARRHRIPRARYKVGNWPEYDRALQHRGSLTVWVTPEALAAWHPPKTGRRGRSPQYAAVAIETGHLLRLADLCTKAPNRRYPGASTCPTPFSTSAIVLNSWSGNLSIAVISSALAPMLRT